MPAKYSDAERKQWLAAQPKKVVVAKLVAKTDEGKILIVNPTYVDKWQLPGGLVESGEDPKGALIREVGEELGIALEPAQLQIIDTVYRASEDTLILVYEYLPALAPDATLTLPPDELSAYQFVEPRKAQEKLGSHYVAFWDQYLAQ